LRRPPPAPRSPALAADAALDGEAVAAAFGEIMDGVATPAQIGGLLMALRLRGETADQLAGAARAMRARALPLRLPDGVRAVDTCGTGGDASGSVNVSTLAAIIVAGAGVTVAKHGNRALSSRSGSADVLGVLGVRIDAPPAVVERCLAGAGIGFAFAPTFHAATRHAAGPRRELGTRTLFNLLGPMTNPAGVAHQVIGVFDPAWCAPMAAALGQLGAARVFVLHGAGGIDEVAVRRADRGRAVARRSGRDAACSRRRRFGLEEVDPAGLAGSDAERQRPRSCARSWPATASGRGSRVAPPYNAAVMEAALALVACGLAEEPRAGAAQAAARAGGMGAAAAALATWARLSNEPAPVAS
jgi:anthranilate phosphoribosyltransferase